MDKSPGSSAAAQGETPLTVSQSKPIEEAELVTLVVGLRMGTGAVNGTSTSSGTLTRRTMLPTADASPGVALDAHATSSSMDMGNVDTLDLCHRKIDKLPEQVIQVLKDEVVRLAIGYNLLSTLPPSFAQLTKLRYLNVRANLLTTFPTVITELPSLEILDASRNKIKSLPEEPGRLLNLRVLSISNNRMRRLPRYVAQMRHLKILKIEHNPLVWPPPHIATVPAISTSAADRSSSADGEKKTERERLMAARRKAEDRTMNAWIKELRSWIADQSSA